MASKKRLAYKRKKMSLSKQDAKYAFYRETLKQVQDANARITSLSRKYKTYSWATKRLFNRLNTTKLNAIKNNRIKITPNMTMTQLTTVRNAINMYMRSMTSTKSGIKQVSFKIKKSLKATLSIDREIDEEDVERIYETIGTDVFNYFADQIGSSTVLNLIADAKEYNESQDVFIVQLIKHGCNSQDKDFRENAIYLYEKYVI